MRSGYSKLEDLVDGALANSHHAATNGRVFYVYSVTGDDGSSGTSKDAPLATIEAAVNLTVADRQDVIFVLPNHVESITAATSLVVDKNSISIIGLGTGFNAPQLTFDNTAGKVVVTAHNAIIENIIFMNSLAAVVTAVEVTGTYNKLINCRWDFDATGLEHLVMLDLDTADFCEVLGCFFRAENIAGCNTGIRIDASPGLIIDGCTFRGDFTTACISGTAGSAATSDDIQISNNIIENLDTTAGLLIDVHDDTTGIIFGNYGFTHYDTDPATAFDPGDCFCIKNFVVNDENETGIEEPEAIST
jgi:hypothetical protein